MKLRLFVLFVSTLVFSGASFARTSSTTTAKAKSSGHVTESAHAQKRMARLRHKRAAARHATAHGTKAKAASARARTAKASSKAATLQTVSLHRRRPRHHRWVETFTGNSFSDDNTDGDIVEGEDPVVRQAAIDALGNMNGTVVAIDPTSGRILAMVNQKLALSEGAQPCSTIKVAVALAGLSEKVITRQEAIALGGRSHMTLTEALAHSNNAYFEAVGRRLGFPKVSYYAHQFGLGELAGYGIDGEHLGTFPTHELDEKLGGVGKMCSFGESISMTPLQLGALVSAVANGGTLYYLQHPTSVDQVINFQPRVKRQLEIGPLVPEIADGMTGAVQYGTARRLRLNFSEEQILGKTGTCSKDGTRFGWFASYADTQYGHIVTVVFLEGGRPTFGPKAAEISGKFYRALYDHNFFAARATTVSSTPTEKPAVGVQQ
ncbi:MAG TPA: penicillin-binding transpeptidase domain-containing protein [Candidatus Angelobacter sp.]|jgi:beta-lactamase class D